MGSFSFFILFLALFGCTIPKALAEKDQITSLKRTLPGHWKEDQYKRQNLNNFLYEMGVGWVKRVFATSSSWENEQNIYTLKDGENFEIDVVNGPRAEILKFTLITDNRSFTDVDIGTLGGITDATSKFKGYSLVTSLRKKDDPEIFMTATRTVNPENPNEMIYETKHVKSGVAMTSIYNRRTCVKGEAQDCKEWKNVKEE